MRLTHEQSASVSQGASELFRKLQETETKESLPVYAHAWTTNTLVGAGSEVIKQRSGYTHKKWRMFAFIFLKIQIRVPVSLMHLKYHI